MTHYSYPTSLPAYLDNQVDKKFQKDMIYSLILQKKETCLRELADLIGIEQSTVSGRVNDLIEANKVTYNETIFYKGRNRKKIVAV